MTEYIDKARLYEQVHTGYENTKGVIRSTLKRVLDMIDDAPTITLPESGGDENVQ